MKLPDSSGSKKIIVCSLLLTAICPTFKFTVCLTTATHSESTPCWYLQMHMAHLFFLPQPPLPTCLCAALSPAPPITPYLPLLRKDSNGSGLIQAVIDQHFPGASIQSSHFNGIASCVCPVEVPGNPVHCQAICSLQTLTNNSFHVAAIQISPPG